MSICFFIGHRDAPESLYPSLRDEVLRHVLEYGVTEFLVGHYGAFDHMAARAVCEIKKARPDIRLTLLLPYHPTERSVLLPDGFDGALYPPDMERVPRKLAIVRANHYAFSRSNYLISFVRYPGNSEKLLEYAQTLRRLLITRL